MAAQELLRKGCRKPIILTGTHKTHRTRDRMNDFVAELAAANIHMEPEQVISLPCIKRHVTESQEIIRYLVTKGMDFDSIFAMNDGWALGAYMGISKTDLKIPQDVKLVGFDGISSACTEVLNITSIQQNVTLLTRHACEMLEALMEKRPVKEKRIIVPTTVLPGQTT